MSVANLLRDVDRGLAVLKNAEERFAEQLAPRFRIFDYLRNDELGLSRCIADLLDAEGTHGQGNVFLNEFIKIAELPSWVKIDRFSKPKLEHKTVHDRRIDITLQSKEGVIGIENKPWAADLDNQLSDYADFLPKIMNNENWLLLYFSNQDPAVKSIPEQKRRALEDNNHFIHVTYKQLVRWLQQCSFRSRALSVRIFIEELAKYVRSDINGELDMSKETEVQKHIKKNLKSAFAVYSALPSVKLELFRMLMCDLEDRLKNDAHANGLFYIQQDDNLIEGKAGHGFNIHFEDNQKYILRFEFVNSEFNGFCWGIRRINELVDYVEGQYVKSKETMDENFGSGQNPEQGWPWWRFANKGGEFGADYRDWSRDATPWLAIDDGSLAEKIIAVANKVYVAFENEMHLLRGS